MLSWKHFPSSSSDELTRICVLRSCSNLSQMSPKHPERKNTFPNKHRGEFTHFRATANWSVCRSRLTQQGCRARLIQAFPSSADLQCSPWIPKKPELFKCSIYSLSDQNKHPTWTSASLQTKAFLRSFPLLRCTKSISFKHLPRVMFPIHQFNGVFWYLKRNFIDK